MRPIFSVEFQLKTVLPSAGAVWRHLSARQVDGWNSLLTQGQNLGAGSGGARILERGLPIRIRVLEREGVVNFSIFIVGEKAEEGVRPRTRASLRVWQTETHTRKQTDMPQA